MPPSATSTIAESQATAGTRTLNGHSPAPKTGIIRFVEVDQSVGHEERSIYAQPANKRAVEERFDLHDVRSKAASSALVEGSDGLDAQGFVYVKHASAVPSPVDGEGLSEQQIREVYIAETEALVRDLTGAKRAVVNNLAIRRKHVTAGKDLSFYRKRGDAIELKVKQAPQDVASIVGGGNERSVEPTRPAHIDFSLQGLRDTARYCRKDIKEAAQEALDAEDAGAAEVPRYATFSVWRPLKTVHRDPLAVCDWRTVNPSSDLEDVSVRALSNVTENGEYKMTASSMKPPTAEVKERLKWYWMPEQTPEDVLIIKFADTLSEVDGKVAGGCPHGAVELDDVDGASEDPRESIEARVLAFW